MNENKWHWQGGRLVSSDGSESLSVTEAWKRIPKDVGIAMACEISKGDDSILLPNYGRSI